MKKKDLAQPVVLQQMKSTPKVVPGAALAMAQAGVGGFFRGVGIQPPTRFILYSYIVALAYIRLIVVHPMNPML